MDETVCLTDLLSQYKTCQIHAPLQQRLGIGQDPHEVLNIIQYLCYHIGVSKLLSH